MIRSLLCSSAIGICGVLSLSSLPTPAYAQDAKIAPIVEQAEQENLAVTGIDYARMNDFMQRFSGVQGGRPSISYKLIRENNLEFLETYETYLTSQNLDDLANDDLLAYWLNVQNFAVIKAISVEGKKKKDLKKLRGTAQVPGKFWTQDRITIDGQAYSLHSLEQNILQTWSEPEVIYGLYQGVKGGPCVTQISYTGATVRQALDEAARQYVNSRGIVNVTGRKAEVTPIYDWYKDVAFSGDDTAVIQHIQSHAAPNLASALYRAQSIDIVALNYRVDRYNLKQLKFEAERPNRPRQQPPAGQSQRRQQRPRGGGSYGS